MSQRRQGLKDNDEEAETIQEGPGSLLDTTVDPATRERPARSAEEVSRVPEAGAHMELEEEPSGSSLWPFTVAVGTLIIAAAVLSRTPVLLGLGVVVLVVAVIGWLWEPWVS